MKTEKQERTVRTRLRMLTLIAVAVAAAIVVITALVLSSNEIKSDYRLIAQTATAHLKDSLEFSGNGAWFYNEENGTIYCGGEEITVELFNKINKSDSTVFHTVFLDDTRVLTNIKNDQGEYVLGTQADPKIYASVKSGNTYTKNGVKIINSKYTVCYMPIYDEEDEFFGMLFTGINQAAVNKSVATIAISIALGSVVALVLVAVISNKILAGISNNLAMRLGNEYNELNNFSDGIRKTSDRTGSEVDEITKAMNGLAEEAMGLASATEEAMASTDEFNNSINTVNDEIKSSYEYISTINDCVEASENSVTELNESIDSSNEVVRNISDDIERGVESTKRANSIVDSIDAIALQINLLALNASIEASHAGQYGKGFAVVADEIKTLAQSSAESAQKTADIINEIVDTMNKTSKSNESLIAANKEQLVKAGVVRQKMETLKTSITGIETGLQNIREKANALGYVKDNLSGVISRLSTTSQQNAAVAEEVSASTDSVRNDVDELAEGIDSISRMCDDLKAIIDYFG